MQPSNANLGRGYIYELYSSDQSASLTEAIDQYFHSTSVFHANVGFISNGAGFTYDIHGHTFEQVAYSGIPDPKTLANWERDHIIHKINEFSASIFQDSYQKQVYVKAYLLQQLGGQNADQFKKNGQCKNEKNIINLFDEIKEQRFISNEDLAEEEEYLKSDQYKIDQLNKQIVEQEQHIQRCIRYFEHDRPTLPGIKGRVEDRLRSHLSSRGRENLQKIVTACSNIIEGYQSGRDISRIDFQMLLEAGRHYRNCLDQYKDIDSLYDSLAKLNGYLDKRAGLEQQLQELLSAKEEPVVDELFDVGDALLVDQPLVLEDDPVAGQDLNVEDDLVLDELLEIDDDPVVIEQLKIEDNQAVEDQNTSWIMSFFGSIADTFASIFRWFTNLFR